MYGKRKLIGNFIDGTGIGNEANVWLSVFSYKDVNMCSIFFTSKTEPYNKDWYGLLTELGFKCLMKGSYQYDFYYKIIITKPIDKMQPILDKLEKENLAKFNYSVKKITNKIVSELI
jgi:hypothetical protein